jgi:Ser/Thr protein kinase RdoA (MazF antagonist)
VDDATKPARVAERFVIAAAVDDIAPFGAGLVNDTFLVHTRADDYVLQRINTVVFRDPVALMQNVVTVAEHLSGRFVPQLVAARHGDWVVDDATGTWRMWRRVPDAAPCVDLTPDRVRSAARLIGRFHLAVGDLPPDSLTRTIPHFHDPARRVSRLRDAIAADPCGRVELVAAEIAYALGAEELGKKAAELVSHLSPQIAHNDAQMNNILFRADEAVCLVDLDTVMPTARFWDVGDLLRSASTHGAEDDPDPRHNTVDPMLYRAAIDGYRDAVAPVVEKGSVEDAALQLAGPLITYEQALRFLTDYVLGDVYYRTTRPGQNLDRARAQLGLLSSMQGTVTP